ncbi:transposase family protein [Streptomyces avermitilis]|uniref:transposase family protein n=1 Tax=Streptomyces avermitilis TaxID=33903 RepID=UPI0033AAF1B0
MRRQSATVCLIKSPTRQHRAIGPLTERLRKLAGPRHRRGKRHPFVSVLLIACSAVLCGARSFAAIGQGHETPRRPGLSGSAPVPQRPSTYATRRAWRPSAAS